MNINTFYKNFNPTDNSGNAVASNQFMKTKKFNGTHDEIIVKKFMSNSQDDDFEFTMNEPERGQIVVNIIKYNFLIPENYKITAIIYNTGNIQIWASFRDAGSKNDELMEVRNTYNLNEMITKGIFDEDYSIEYMTGVLEAQVDNIYSLFTEIRELISEKIELMRTQGFDIIEEKIIDRKSDMIYPTVTGILPYKKKAKLEAGNVVDFFNDSIPEWRDNNYWSKDNNERGYVVRILRKGKLYLVVKGVPFLDKITIDKDFVNFSIDDAPLVLTSGGSYGFLLETYIPEKPKHWVILGDPEEMTGKNLRIHKTNINDDNVYTKDGTKVAGTKTRPKPYSFYGQCQNGLTQYIDRIGIKARGDSRYHPVCKPIVNRNQAVDEVTDFILNGLDGDLFRRRLAEEEIDPDVEFDVNMNGAVLKDKYAGTFIPGTIDLGNKITFLNEEQEWVTGVLTDYTKSHGLGGDFNHTDFTITVDEVDHIVRGEDFHPMHRENRNFPGINKIFKTEDAKKDFLIDCARKLNLVIPDTPEKEEAKVQKQVLKKLMEITGSNDIIDTIKESNPFSGKNISALKNYAYTAAVIPSFTTRCVLMNTEDKQYLIDKENKVMRIYINDIPDKHNY